jgi:threonylcarbamoyladenosine tRNA methylthiotransferase MtaB
MARGLSRSDTLDNIIENAKELAKAGVKEIVLTGVNLGDYKKDQHQFIDLIKALDQVDGIERFRISSIEPNLLTNEIIEFVSTSNKFMPHFHIPLQSGNNEILGKMRRRYKRELYADRVATIKKLMPHCCIGVDVIVGFPSESDAHFKDTYQFLADLDISYLHVFTYSERDNTKALEIQPIVPIQIRNERNKQLRNLSYKKMEHFTNQHIGTTRKVLFEKAEKGGLIEGFTDNYIKIEAAYDTALINNIKDWKLV